MAMQDLIINEESIKTKIHTIRGVQVMLDRDLAELYGVKPIRLREQMRRNIDRFPDDFMFELSKEEADLMVSQNAIPSKQHLGGSLPYVFTEQGVSMLSAVLKTQTAVAMSIKIIRAFVDMRHFISQNIAMFERFERIENRLSIYDKNFHTLFNALEDRSLKPTQGIFYDAQIYDAYDFINTLLKSAKSEVVLIDNYIDESVFTLFSKYQDLRFTIHTNNITK